MHHLLGVSGCFISGMSSMTLLLLFLQLTLLSYGRYFQVRETQFKAHFVLHILYQVD